MSVSNCCFLCSACFDLLKLLIPNTTEETLLYHTRARLGKAVPPVWECIAMILYYTPSHDFANLHTLNVICCLFFKISNEHSLCIQRTTSRTVTSYEGLQKYYITPTHTVTMCSCTKNYQCGATTFTSYYRAC